MSGQQHWRTMAVAVCVWAAAMALGAGSGMGQVGAEPAVAGARLSAATTEELVGRVVKHPHDEGPWEELRKPERREEAMKLLVAAFKDPVNEVAEGEQDKTEGGRDRILGAIAGIFRDGAADVLMGAVKDDDYRVRIAAVELLGRGVSISTPATRRALREATWDRDYEVVDAARRSLEVHPDAEAGPLALAALRKVPPLTAEVKGMPPNFNSGEYSGYWERPGLTEAMGALGATEFAGGVMDLLVLSRDTSAYVRSEAARALAYCALGADAELRARAVEQLRDMLGDPHDGVRLAAALGLADLKDGAGAGELMFDLRRQTRPYDESSRSIWLLRTVTALEYITGEDLGASRGKAFWCGYPSGKDETEAKVKALRPLVEVIEQRVAAHGLATGGAPPLPAQLTMADKLMFARGFRNWLVDPKGGTLIIFERQMRRGDGATYSDDQRGWLFPAAAGRSARVMLADRAELPVPAKWKAVNLAAEAGQLMADYRSGKEVYPSLINAAWLFRLGEEQLAAEELFLVRGSTDEGTADLDVPDEGLAWNTYAEAVNAFIARADDEALVSAKRMAKVYPMYLEKFGPGAELLADLRRRKAEGTLNHAQETLPADFDAWPVDKRVTWLVRDFEDVEAPESGVPGGGFEGQDWRVRKLIAIGDAAVPALIDCIEKDRRLTRWAPYFRESNRLHIRGIESVEKCALAAVCGILQTSEFEPEWKEGLEQIQESPEETAGLLRAYWATYGKLPLDERMMKVLTDEKASDRAVMDAVESLSDFGNSDERQGGRAQKPAANPVIGRYKNPTVAEAILAARDRFVAKTPPKDDQDQTRRVEPVYLSAVARLGDGAIVPELKRRFAAALPLEERRRWARLCFDLGDEGPERELAEGFKRGTIDLATADPLRGQAYRGVENQELRGFVKFLIEADRPYADEALYALAGPGHPYHKLALEMGALVAKEPSWDDASIWLSHPFCFTVMRPLLDQTKETGEKFTLSSDGMTNKNGWWRLSDAALEANPQELAPEAKGRACDAAGIVMSNYLVGVSYDPMFVDADARLAGLRAYVDKYGKQLRVLTGEERKALKLDRWHVVYVPKFEGLKARATEADVAAGRAVFALTGKRTPTFQALPATGRLVADRGNKDAARVLIVQAEMDEAGVVHYGIVEQHRIREVTEREVEDVVAVPAEKK